MKVNPEDISGKFPHFSRPTYIGDFATNFAENEIHIGRSRVRYLREDLVNKNGLHLDLNEGLSVFEAKADEDEHLEGLLKYILKTSEPDCHIKKVLHDADIVSWRGTLTRIGISPFETRGSDGWKVLCTTYGGVVFICELSTSQKSSKRNIKTDREKKMTYWGYKFEQYTTTDRLNGQPETTIPVSTMSNYSAVFKLDVGSRTENSRLKIFMGAEMDCLNEKGEFIELKTQFNQIGIGRYWYQKEMKWWLQSFLVGIDTIVVGLRDDNGVVRQTKAVKVNDLARRPNGWNPAICLNFLLSVLHRIQLELKSKESIIAEFDPTTKNVTFTEPAESDKQNAFIYGFQEHFKL